MELPEPSVDWLLHSPIRTSPGSCPSCTVLHRASAGSPHQFVVHLAVHRDGAWTYCHGDYFLRLRDAMKSPRLDDAV